MKFYYYSQLIILPFTTLVVTASVASSFSLHSFTTRKVGRSSSTTSSSTGSSTFIHRCSSYSKDTVAELPSFETKEEYEEYLLQASGLPLGFSTGTAKGTFVSVEAPSMGELPIKASVIYLEDGPTDSWAAVFTKNKFPGSPIKVGRKRLASGKPIQALVINNKVSNVCSGGDGEGDAEMVCKSVADILNLSGGSDSVLPSSTGVIGWRLPAKELAEQVVPEAIKNLQSESALSAARDIMTTDRYPKLRSKTLSNGARIVGIAKGAGMIEPNMATMLCYVMTDADIPKETLQSMLSGSVDDSFNSISVDGSESTSDTCVVISSRKVSDVSVDEFKDALDEITKGLAADLVRNGEGTAHVMRIKVTGFPGSDLDARELGRFISNSALFKCAVAGNDPNTGRLAGAMGSFMGRFHNDDVDLSDVSFQLGGRTIFANGKFILEGDDVEQELSDHMKDAELGEVDEYPKHQKFVEIHVDFGNAGGNGSAEVIGSDLTKEYVAVNADYRS
eukprot:CAMPEP_0197827492 /NCGR_PEP_ID=MMETSP1437-20131217/4247_1 /TAXON_ID=49252 ORGANISM="Eucampia antarctica, Strain CCMP1452" /NCGR_SAMPLE_ID=MMETSP1437 /ASSEMBLY_ACC=CAM_ASM_001096 /LENGTH=504 /DNA_ID=CAMNT_0043428341 /DNA_START=15 /DNA_END=1529 /DNA_ORIENTATION=+